MYQQFYFFLQVAPILSVGNASLVAISTLTSEINFYTRLIKMADPGKKWNFVVNASGQNINFLLFNSDRSSFVCHALHRALLWTVQGRRAASGVQPFAAFGAVVAGEYSDVNCIVCLWILTSCANWQSEERHRKLKIMSKWSEILALLRFILSILVNCWQLILRH